MLAESAEVFALYLTHANFNFYLVKGIASVCANYSWCARMRAHISDTATYSDCKPKDCFAAKHTLRQCISSGEQGDEHDTLVYL